MCLARPASAAWPLRCGPEPPARIPSRPSASGTASLRRAQTLGGSAIHWPVRPKLELLAQSGAAALRVRLCAIYGLLIVNLFEMSVAGEPAILLSTYAGELRPARAGDLASSFSRLYCPHRAGLVARDFFNDGALQGDTRRQADHVSYLCIDRPSGPCFVNVHEMLFALKSKQRLADAREPDLDQSVHLILLEQSHTGTHVAHQRRVADTQPGRHDVCLIRRQALPVP